MPIETNTDRLVIDMDPLIENETCNLIRFLKRNGVCVFKNDKFFVSFGGSDSREMGHGSDKLKNDFELPGYVEQIMGRNYGPLNGKDVEND